MSALECADKGLEKTKDIVHRGSEQDGYAYEYADESFKNGC
jgi:hypothetical protein